MDRGVGVTIDRRSALTDTLKAKEIEGEPLLNENALQALIRLLRLAQVSLVLLMTIVIVNKPFLLGVNIFLIVLDIACYVDFYVIRFTVCYRTYTFH
jgi:hypothetical protein